MEVITRSPIDRAVVVKTFDRANELIQKTFDRLEDIGALSILSNNLSITVKEIREEFEFTEIDDNYVDPFDWYFLIFHPIHGSFEVCFDPETEKITAEQATI